MEKTNKYSCLIIDDEPIALKVISNYLDKIDKFVFLGGFTNALEALSVLHKQNVDLIFLDIQMPGINGLEFIKSIPQPPRVIFTTAFRNYASDAFDVDAIDYLVKPIPYDRFLKAVNKFFEHQNRLREQNSDSIILKSDKKNYKVMMDDIIYIESLDDYIKVHTKQNNLICYMRLSGIENMLGNSKFIRIHRAFVVNQKHITLFTHSLVEINGKQLPIGRNYREEVLKKLQ